MPRADRPVEAVRRLDVHVRLSAVPGIAARADRVARSHRITHPYANRAALEVREQHERSTGAHRDHHVVTRDS